MGRRGASILTLANGGCRNLWYDYSLISGTIDRRAGQGSAATRGRAIDVPGDRVASSVTPRIVRLMVKTESSSGMLEWH